jgi:hypothetical protein
MINNPFVFDTPVFVYEVRQGCCNDYLLFNPGGEVQKGIKPNKA